MPEQPRTVTTEQGDELSLRVVAATAGIVAMVCFSLSIIPLAFGIPDWYRSYHAFLEDGDAHQLRIESSRLMNSLMGPALFWGLSLTSVLTMAYDLWQRRRLRGRASQPAGGSAWPNWAELRPCKGCGQDVSFLAIFCPSCGRKNPYPLTWREHGVFVGIMLVGFGLPVGSVYGVFFLLD